MEIKQSKSHQLRSYNTDKILCHVSIINAGYLKMK